MRREGDARSCSAAFCVFIPISSPSAMPARYVPPSFFPHACLQVILMVKSLCPGDSIVKRKKKIIVAMFLLGERVPDRGLTFFLLPVPPAHRNRYFIQT